jgi:hypothetical protein
MGRPRFVARTVGPTAQSSGLKASARPGRWTTHDERPSPLVRRFGGQRCQTLRDLLSSDRFVTGRRVRGRLGEAVEMWAGRACGAVHISTAWPHHSLAAPQPGPHPSSPLALRSIRGTLEAPPGRMAVAANQTNGTPRWPLYQPARLLLLPSVPSSAPLRLALRLGRAPMRIHHAIPAKVERVVRDLPTLAPLLPTPPKAPLVRPSLSRPERQPDLPPLRHRQTDVLPLAAPLRPQTSPARGSLDKPKLFRKPTWSILLKRCRPVTSIPPGARTSSSSCSVR